MPWRPMLPSLGLALTLLLGGCIVDPSYGRCTDNDECPGGQICELATGQCYLQCQKDADCYVNNLPVGKSCKANRCVFTLSDRVPAPNFCLKTANPKSSSYNKDTCLSSLKGKVVMIYFGQLG